MLSELEDKIPKIVSSIATFSETNRDTEKEKLHLLILVSISTS
jgi:hypothetical protein